MSEHAAPNLTPEIQLIMRIAVEVDNNTKKLDQIIERNNIADNLHATTRAELSSHMKMDEALFKKNDNDHEAFIKKHSWYDKTLIGVLVFIIGELIWVIKAIHP